VNVRVNQRMLQLLGGDPEFFEMSAKELPAALLEKAATPLTEKDGCIVPLQKPTAVFIDDETGTECFWTKFHLDDYLPAGTTIEEFARTALDFVWPLRSSIASSQLTGSFRMIASVDPACDEEEIPSCTIRFHRLRPNQAWISDELESYKKEAIAVCDFTIP